jgi:hypothetical protein
MVKQRNLREQDSYGVLHDCAVHGNVLTIAVRPNKNLAHVIKAQHELDRRKKSIACPRRSCIISPISHT